MSTWWVSPSQSVDADALAVIDVHCRWCRDAGDENPERLASFALLPDGRVGVRAFTVKGQPSLPGGRARANGRWTWWLKCCHGKAMTEVRHERIAQWLAARQAGMLPQKIYR